MEHDALKHWLVKQVDHIQEDALSVQPGFFPETIHRFRTGTKKLRAVMRLGAARDGTNTILPRSFRNLYKAAGELRDKQVLLQLIVEDKRHKLSTFAIWVGHKIGESEYTLSHEHSHRALEKLHGFVAALRPVADLLTLRRYYSEQLENIRKLFAPGANDEALHEIRKIAKDLQYISGCCKKIWPEGNVVTAPTEAPLELLSDKAGAYNDRRNLLDMLEQFRKEYETELTDAESAALKQAGIDWLKAKARERKSLLLAIRQLLN